MAVIKLRQNMWLGCFIYVWWLLKLLLWFWTIGQKCLGRVFFTSISNRFLPIWKVDLWHFHCYKEAFSSKINQIYWVLNLELGYKKRVFKRGYGMQWWNWSMACCVCMLRMTLHDSRIPFHRSIIPFCYSIFHILAVTVRHLSNWSNRKQRNDPVKSKKNRHIHTSKWSP